MAGYRLLLVILVFLLCGCVQMEGNEIRKEDIDIFKGTDAWELALAVKNENVKMIEKIAGKSPELRNYQDPLYDITPLIWAVGMEKYKSAEALLRCGADPNIIANGVEKFLSMAAEALATGNLSWFYNVPKLLLGETALYIAAGYSWIDNDYKKDPKYVKLLLEYGADPNICHIGIEPISMPNGTVYHYGSEQGTSPLMHSIGRGIEKTKALVEAGADINHKSESGNTAASIALMRACSNSPTEDKEYAYYLIVGQKAIVTEPSYRNKATLMSGDDPNDEFYNVDLLRDWIPELDSDEYRMKMEIVDEFTRQGADYSSTKIYQDTLQQIQYIYSDTWEEYIKVY